MKLLPELELKSERCAQEGFVVELCTFESIGGNGVVLDGANARATLRYNEFHRVGDSAMVAVGETAGIDGYSAPRSANFTRVVSNFVHEIGLVGKQVSSWCQMLAVNSLVGRGSLASHHRLFYMLWGIYQKL